MALSKNVKTRRDLYIIGLILIFQICFFAQIPDFNYRFADFIKLVTLSGFYFICGECLYTLYLVINKKATFSEFAVYLGGILVVLMLAVIYVGNKFQEANHRHHPMGDTTRIENKD
jgi:hypothetical protein